MKRLQTIVLLVTLLPGAMAAALELQFKEPEELRVGGTLVLPVPEDLSLPGNLDGTARETLAGIMAGAKFKGEAKTSLVQHALLGYDKVILLGTGAEPLTPVALRDLGGSAAQALGDRAGGASLLLPEGLTEAEDPAVHVALGARLGGYRFDKYKSKEDEAEGEPTTLAVHATGATAQAALWDQQWRGVAEAVYFTRDLINEPANVIYPESFVARAREAFRGLDNVSIKVLDERQMEKRSMGALLGVGMGSERPPRLLVVEYSGGERDAAPLVFVGKGVTFDSGGVSLKSAKGMWRMKYDMSGAAAVTGTVLALARREAPVNVVAIAALVENMPSQMAQRPGDVRTTASGKTIEVLNTDAEGRLILSDAVWYAQEEYDPALMIDVATLTGSVKVALGEVYAGLFTRQDDVAEQLLAAGEASGEVAWRLPLHPTFRDAIKSDIADIKNVVEGGWGGASLGAEVIGAFVADDTRWAHLDIAGRAWNFEPKPTVPAGAAGWGVLLLNQLVLDNYQ